MRRAYKFLAEGTVSPFTGFRWPEAGAWVEAPVEREERWIFACRPEDLPYWLDRELWVLELDGPAREARHQLSAPRARLVHRVAAWTAEARGAYAAACAARAQELALPALPPGLRERVAAASDPAAVSAALGEAAPTRVSGYLGDAAKLARDANAVSYVAAVLAAAVSGAPAAFDAERAWQARWLARHLALDA